MCVHVFQNVIGKSRTLVKAMYASTEATLESWTVLVYSEKDAINEDVLNLVETSLFVVVQGAAAVIGVVSNFLNVAVFISIGMKDSMSVGLFALSLTDLIVVVATFGRCICDGLAILHRENPFKISSVCYNAFGWSRTCTFLISCWITAMISVERCFCVVSPFRVREVFTRVRCCVVIATIYIVHVGIYFPVFLGMRVEVKNSSSESFTYFAEEPEYVIAILISAISMDTELAVDVSTSVILSLLSQSLILLCTVWMIYALKISSSVRLMEANLDNPTENQTGSKLARKMAKLSAKEKKLVTVVLALSIISLVCCIPKFISVFAYYTLTEENLARTILNHEMWHFGTLFGTFCCSSSFVVYFKLGSNYKRAFAKFPCSANWHKL